MDGGCGVKTRAVQGHALPASAIDLLALDGDLVGVVLSDGSMLQTNGFAPPEPVLGPGPRPVAVFDGVVHAVDGSQHALGDSRPRAYDVEGTGIAEWRSMPEGMALLMEDGRLVVMAHHAPPHVVAKDVEHLLAASPSSLMFVDRSGLQFRSLDSTAKDWQRPERGSTGERITAACHLPHGVAVAREGHGLDGLEDEVEVEIWREGVLERCFSHDDVVLRLLHTSLGLVLTDQSGGVHRATEDGLRELHRGTSSALDLLELDDELCVASWFHLHGLDATGVVWTVEHAGMPRRLLRCGQRLFFAGDDGNDWTGPEPLGVIDLDTGVQDIDPSELTLWFPSPASVEPTAEATTSVLEAFVEPEEVVAWRPPVGLMDALTQEVAVGEEKEAGEEDLLTALTRSPPHETAVRFEVDLGEDRRVEANEEGVAEVLLAATIRGAPEEGLLHAWLDAEGREISARPKVLLRLPVGVHRFELRVKHPDGRWVMDTLAIEVQAHRA